MLKITEDTTLAGVLKRPEAKKILEKYNLPCLSCPFAKIEAEKLKIGQVCQMYGIETKKLLEELVAEALPHLPLRPALRGSANKELKK